MSVLSVKQLSVSFQQQGQTVTALDKIAFDLMPGETLALVGESGSGKSLTALALMQLLPLHASLHAGSEILFKQDDLMMKSEVQMRQIRGKHMAMIFQEPMTALNPVLTVGEQMVEVLRQHQRLGSQACQQRVLELFKEVGIAEAKARFYSYPHQLSGGLKQRVMIAMALALKPHLLIADEPTTALDVTIQAQILELLRRLQREHRMALLLITHDLGVVRQMADHIAVMYAGQIIEQAPVKEFFNEPKHPYSQQLLATLPNNQNRDLTLNVIPGQVPILGSFPTACRFAPRCKRVWAHCEQHAPVINKTQDQHYVRCHLYDKTAEQAENSTFIETPTLQVTGNISEDTLLELFSLKVHFPIKRGLLQRAKHWVKAVDGVDLKVARGCTLAIVGESGCGKTTVAKTLVGLVSPSAGEIRWQQHSLLNQPRATRARQLQMIFQDPFAALNPRRMIYDIITEGLRDLAKQERLTRAKQLLAQVGLPAAMLMRYPHQLSGGQRQRLGIARALAMNPQLIVCDEPTSALDVSVQAQVLNLLKQIQAEQGMTYVFISHDMAVVSYMADTIAVMYLGRIVEQGAATTILQSPQHPYTQALLAAVPQITSDEPSKRLLLQGEQPSPIHPPEGCHFHARCPHAMPQCRVHYPVFIELSTKHRVSCHLYAEKKKTNE